MYQVETRTIEIEILAETRTVVDFTEATTQLSYEIHDDTTVDKVCTIVNNFVSATITAAESADMYGKYPFEVKIKDVSDNIDLIVKAVLKVKKSIIPSFGTV